MSSPAQIKDFDHLDPSVATGIHEFLGELRRSCPVARSECYGGFFVVTKQDDIVEIAKDAGRFSSAVQGLGAATLLPELDQVCAPLFETDPPVHTGWRRTMQEFFTPTAVAAYGPGIRDATCQVVDELRPRGKCDFVADLAVRIPPIVVGVLLGVPIHQRSEFSRLVQALVTSRSAQETQPVQTQLAEFLLTQIRGRRGEKPDNVLTAVVNARVDGRVATDHELIKYAFLMVAAGYLTTTDTISNTLLVLAQDPELRRRVVDEPGLIPALIEESVRYESAVAATGRTVRGETTLGGVDLSPGDRLLLTWGSANRDEEYFPDGHEFRLHRGRGRQLAWGMAAHKCLGMHLARLELRIVFEEVLRAIPDFRLSLGAEPVRTYGVLRGVRSLPVEWPV